LVLIHLSISDFKKEGYHKLNYYQNMKTSSGKITTILIFIFYVLLIVPALQKSLQLVEVKPLKGAIMQLEKPEFSLMEWSEGKFQLAREEYLNQNFGFREIFVRLNNEIQFRLFNKAKANGVIIGKNDYLYERAYIDAYYGRDFIGYKETDERFKKLKFINDKLAAQNKTLLLVFCPGKASFYPEYIPDSLKGEMKTTNFSAHIEYAEKYKLNFINFQSYFLNMKKDSAYQIYPQSGIHWSVYGASLAADSIAKKVERLRSVDLPDIRYDKIEYSYPQKGDADVAEAMNLLFNTEGMNNRMLYPQISFENNNKDNVSLLVISDSFYWAMVNLTTNIFQNDHFWFFNRQVIPGNQEVKNLDFGQELADHDVIMLMATEPNLKKFGWDFIEDAFNYYSGNSNSAKEDKLRKTIKYIKSDKAWMEKIKEKAAKHNISVDSMVYLDAQWSITH